VARSARLPADGLAVFAAPDGRAVVPLSAEDATAVVDTSGKVESWPGRLFPLFFADFDRMHAVLPGALVTLSYPERVQIARLPLAGVPGARRAACSADGRLVAIVPAAPGVNALVLVAALEGGDTSRVELDGDATAVALHPEGAFALTATGGGVVEVAGEGRSRPLGMIDLGGEVRALAFTADGRGALAGCANGSAGAIVGIRVDPAAKSPLKERFRTPLPRGVVAVAAGEDEVVALTDDTLVVLSADGKRVRRRIAVAGGTDVALLPTRPRSAVPAWSDRKGP